MFLILLQIQTIFTSVTGTVEGVRVHYKANKATRLPTEIDKATEPDDFLTGVLEGVAAAGVFDPVGEELPVGVSAIGAPGTGTLQIAFETVPALTSLVQALVGCPSYL